MRRNPAWKKAVCVAEILTLLGGAVPAQAFVASERFVLNPSVEPAPAAAPTLSPVQPPVGLAAETLPLAGLDAILPSVPASLAPGQARQAEAARPALSGLFAEAPRALQAVAHAEGMEAGAAARESFERAVGLAAPSQSDKELIQLRERVERDVHLLLRNELGGDLGRPDVSNPVQVVLRRVMDANGIDRGAVALHVGSSFIPNAFTTITDTEQKYLIDKGRHQATFKNSNVFISRGLLDAFMGKKDAVLAFVLAHELAHNRLGHLKSLGSSSVMLGHILEFEADGEALTMIARAGYNPREALPFLDLIRDRVEALKKDYPLLRRGDSEFQRMLMRWRDVHPNDAQRRAKLEERLSPALEIYTRSPYKDRPQDALLAVERAARARPIRDASARLEARLTRVVEAQDRPYYDKVVALEAVMTRMIRQGQKRHKTSGQTVTFHYVKLEDQLIVENAVRALAERASSLDDLSNLFDLHRRIALLYPALNFPSRRAMASVIERQVDLVGRTIGPLAAVSTLGAYVGKLSSTALHALFVMHLKRVRTREELDAALSYFGSQALAFDFRPGFLRESVAADLGRTLLLKSYELATPADLPVDERLALAIDHLRAKVPSILLVAGPRGAGRVRGYLSTHLKAELIDFYLTGRVGLEPKWSLRDLALLLEGRPREQILSRRSSYSDDGDARGAGAMEAWNDRYFKAQGADLSQSGNMLFNYERLDARGIIVPKASSLLDILSIFPYRDAKERDKDDSSATPLLLPLEVPETIAAAILQKDAAWQESFWAEAGAWMLSEYARSREQPDALTALKNRLGALARLQASVVRRSERLAPVTAAVRGIGRALREASSPSAAAESKEALSFVSDQLINTVVNATVARQLERARDSNAGIDPRELKELSEEILALDEHYSSFNTSARLRTLSRAFFFAASRGRDLVPLAAYVRQIMKWKRERIGGGGSGGTRRADFFADQNRALFREAGLAADYDKIPAAMEGVMTSGALGLLAAPKTTPSELLGASLAVYLKHQVIDTLRGVGNTEIEQALALLLVEEASRRIKTKEDAEAAADFLRKIHDLDPFYLSYVPRGEMNTDTGFYGGGTSNAIRTEILGALAARKQPFRERDAAVTRGLLEAIERAGGMPDSAKERLVLLDWAARVADYDTWMEDRVLEIARRDPAAFRAWARDDARWTRKIKKPDQAERKAFMVGAVTKKLEELLDLPEDTIKLPDLKPAPLRIIRNPVRRAELYDALQTGPLPETARRSLRDLGATVRAGRSLLAALQFHDVKFLRSVLREASPDARIVMVLQETARVADEMAARAKKRWERGKTSGEDVRILRPYMLDLDSPWWKKARWYFFGDGQVVSWATMSESERRETVAEFRNRAFNQAITKLMKLHDDYAAFLDPELGVILDNFPEPNRTRDDLLERLAKRRRLTPERLSIIESYKSYRLPNPLRFVEKQFIETASVQLEKLAPAERVDMILHMGGVRALPDAELARLEAKMLGRDKRLFVEKNLKIYSFKQYLKYLDQLHPEDKELFVKSMFYGRNSIADEPEQVERLYRAIAIDGRGLPKLVERVLMIYYRLMTPTERVRTIVHLTRNARSGAALSGPEIVKYALENFGITGAKIGQVLATHKGLLPPEYSAALESFKDGAQSLEKAKVLALVEKRLSLLRGRPPRSAADEEPRRRELLAAAEKLYPDANPRARKRWAEEVLALERIKDDGGLVSDVKEIGRELGSGSVKIAYKVTLKDGTTWVAKIRRPGATIDFTREFELLDGLTAELMSDPELQLPNVKALVEEVRTLVLAEMDFKREAVKGRRTEAGIDARPALAALKTGGRVIVAEPHPIYVDEDIALEEFVPSVSFKELPERGFLRVSKRRLARAIVDEAAQALILDEYLDPDRHSGNILQKVWPALLRPFVSWMVKPVWIDLGQSAEIPTETVKPLMRSALAIQHGRLDDSAAALADTFDLQPGQSKTELAALLRARLAERTSDPVMDRLLGAIMKAEGSRYLVRGDYAVLEKAILLLNGYAKYLPRDYLMRALERAVLLKAWRDDPKQARRLVRDKIVELAGGDRYDDISAALESLRSSRAAAAP